MSGNPRPKRRIAAYFGLLVLSASLAATAAVSATLIWLEYRHGMDQAESFARMKETAWIAIPANAAWTLLLAGLIFRLMKKRIIRPLEALARYAREFNADDLFVPLRLPRRGAGPPDEFDDLEVAFNAMRLRLRAVHMEDQIRAAELEIEAHERARQLEAKERNLRDAEIFAHRAVQYLADALIVIDLDGVIRRVNPAAETMFGYTADELLGANVNILMPEPHRSAHDGYLARYRQTG